MPWRNLTLRTNVFLDLRKKLKHKLRFWRADIAIAANLIIFTTFAGLIGGLLLGPAGLIGGALATLGVIQLLDMIP